MSKLSSSKHQASAGNWRFCLTVLMLSAIFDDGNALCFGTEPSLHIQKHSLICEHSSENYMLFHCISSLILWTCYISLLQTEGNRERQYGVRCLPTALMKGKAVGNRITDPFTKVTWSGIFKTQATQQSKFITKSDMILHFNYSILVMCLLV